MNILGIESSCDETAAAVVSYKRGRFLVLSNVVASQVKLHAKTGGVVPEVAARQHAEVIVPIIERALRAAKIKKPDVIAVTHGPGLITSLRIGVDAARALAAAWDVPLVGVNHLEGHIYANWLHDQLHHSYHKKEVQFPALALIVSGGHTELVLMRQHLDYKIIGATRDDAVGEAFDKVAKLLGLGYPGGPLISRRAEKGNPRAIDFPRAMLNKQNFDFSFSGLKTAVLYYLRDLQVTSYKPQTKDDVCASFEEAVVDVLVQKTTRAAKQYGVKTVMIGGGVAANKHLRESLGEAVKKQLPVTLYSLPVTDFTTDNAAMIAAVGALHASRKHFIPWQKIQADPNLSL